MPVVSPDLSRDAEKLGVRPHPSLDEVLDQIRPDGEEMGGEEMGEAVMVLKYLEGRLAEEWRADGLYCVKFGFARVIAFDLLSL